MTHQTDSEATIVIPLMKIREAATYLGVSESWMKQHSAAIPFVRLGVKHKRWRKEDLDAYVAKNVRGIRGGR